MNNMPDDYAGGPQPHGYPSYRGWVKTCPPECDCPETIAMRVAQQPSPGALLNDED